MIGRSRCLTSHKICCVQGCTSRYKYGMSLHHFPSEKESFRVTVKLDSGVEEKMSRRKAWKMKLSIGKPINKTMQVCSKHFTPNDFCIYIPDGRAGSQRERFRLKTIAVPSQYLPNKNPQKISKLEQSLIRRAFEMSLNTETQYDSSLGSSHFVDGNRDNKPTIVSQDITSEHLRKRRKLLSAHARLEGIDESYNITPSELKSTGDLSELMKPAVDTKQGIVLMEDSKEGIVLVEDSKEGILLVEDSKDDIVLLDDSKEAIELMQDSKEYLYFFDESKECRESLFNFHESQEFSDAPHDDPLRDLETDEKSSASDQSRLRREQAATQHRAQSFKPEMVMEISLGNILTYASMRNNYEVFHYYTGLPNANTFEVLLKYLSASKNNYSQKWNTNVISLDSQLLLTLIKLRLNFDYIDLSVRFQVNRVTVRNVFLTTLNALHSILFPLIKFPSTSEAPTALPNALRKYSNCRCVVDSVEIQCGGSRKTINPSISRKILKALVACTPSGAVIYASKLFPATTPDQQLFTEDGFIQNFVEGDTLLANRRFSVSDILPPGVSIKSSADFNDKKCSESCEGARTRIPIDKVIQRMKSYKILDFISAVMKPSADKIFQLVACLIDLDPHLGHKYWRYDVNSS